MNMYAAVILISSIPTLALAIWAVVDAIRGKAV
jgi:hypothetical protein